ncbi:hypothetical protein D1007_41621 [Hordeum vulgare]|nr:hypothetical protein D1007_41621 [Hordeum vulgare]
MKFQLPSKVLHHRSWALVVSVHVEPTTPSDVLLQSTLAAQAELLVRVGNFLERAEAALGKLSLVLVILQSAPTPGPPSEVDVRGSMENRVVELYGCFFHRVVDNSSSSSAVPTVLSTAEDGTVAVVLRVVLQVMPKLQVLCASSDSPLSMEHTVHMQTTTSEGYDSTLTCEFLSVEAIIPGTGRLIACLLTGMTFKGKYKKAIDCPQTDIVKGKSLRCKGKKKDVIYRRRLELDELDLTMASHDLILTAEILRARQAKGHNRLARLATEQVADDGGDRAWPAGDKAWPGRLGAADGRLGAADGRWGGSDGVGGGRHD